jgi:two-component system response regulator BasR
MLLVEDEPVVLSALKKYFTCVGFDVDCAREVEEAEALIATTHYTIVIADLRLTWTSVDGLAILRFVRHHSRGTHVIILSAHSTPDIQRDARALGAQAFLLKPTPLAEIGATIDRLLGEPS